MCNDVHCARKLWERSQPFGTTLYVTTSGRVTQEVMAQKVFNFLLSGISFQFVYLCMHIRMCLSKRVQPCSRTHVSCSRCKHSPLFGFKYILFDQVVPQVRRIASSDSYFASQTLQQVHCSTLTHCVAGEMSRSFSLSRFSKDVLSTLVAIVYRTVIGTP